MRSFFVAMILGVVGVLWSSCNVLANAPATRPSTPAVIVFRFDVVGDSSHAWVGQALQEGIGSGITQAGAFEAKSAVSVPGSADEAVQSAETVGAARAIVGTCQIVDDQIRVTGSVIDVATGKSLGGLHSTGALKDLFTLEDALASQSGRLLSPSAHVAVSAAPPTIELKPAMTVYQPKYGEGDIRDALAVPDRFGAEWEQYSNSQYPCGGYGYYGCGYGGSYRAFLYGRTCGGGGGWYPSAQPLRSW